MIKDHIQKMLKSHMMDHFHVIIQWLVLDSNINYIKATIDSFSRPSF